jgi:hypothetical protein
MGNFAGEAVGKIAERKRRGVIKEGLLYIGPDPWISLIFVMPPLILFLLRFPRFLSRFVVIGVYFFFVLLVYEITALQIGLWSFPGSHFIGWVNLFGYSFPIEEFAFWMMFATLSVLAYYEYFADDRRL